MAVETIIKFKGDAAQLKQTQQEVKSSNQDLGNSIQGAMEGAAMKFAGVAGALGLVKKAFNFVLDAAREAHGMILMMAQTDLSINQVRVFEAATRKAGAETGAWLADYRKLEKALVDSDKNPAIVGQLERLGVSMKSIDDKDAVKAFEEIGKYLGNIHHTAKNSADTMDIFGKKAGEVVLIAKNLAGAEEKVHEAFLTSGQIETLDQFGSGWRKATHEVKDFTMSAAAGVLQLGMFLVKLTGITDILAGWKAIQPDYKGQADQLKAIDEAEAKLKQKQIEKHGDPEAIAKKEKAAAQEKVKLAKEEKEEKEKLSKEISDQDEKNRLGRMTDAEKLKFYQEELKLAEAQTKEAEKHSELSIQDLKARKSKLELEEKVRDLSKKVNDEQFKEWKDKHKKLASEGGGGATFDGVNHAFSNMGDLKGIQQKQLEVLININKNLTRAGQIPTVFTQ